MKHSLTGELSQALGYEFKKNELITEALTHRSHHHEHGDSFHNERLEFLGDAVLDLLMTEIVMKLSPLTDEGNLSKIRSQLVSENSLALAARKLQLGNYIRLGRGEDQSGGRARDALLADTFEAVIAAVYLDGGFDAAFTVVNRLFDFSDLTADMWETESQKLIVQDSKSLLQEFCQSVGLGAPTYQCVETRGPDHSRKFVMAVYVQGKELGRSEGSTKKEATQVAAKELVAVSQPQLMQLLKDRGLKPRLKNLKASLAEVQEKAQEPIELVPVSAPDHHPPGRKNPRIMTDKSLEEQAHELIGEHQFDELHEDVDTSPRVLVFNVQQNFRCARVAILGRPNAGKSTLLNALMEVSLSATSHRPQTTRSNVRGILQSVDAKKNWDGQLILLDTPGVNFQKGLLERSMYMSIEGALREADIVVWVADGRKFDKDLRDVEMGRPGSDKMAAFLKDRLEKRDNQKWILALSKVDIAEKNRLLPTIERAAIALPQFAEIVPIAAQLGVANNNSNLKALLKVLRDHSPVAPPAYAQDEWTDLDERKLIQNLVREAVFRMAHEEVPYQTDCTILRFLEPEGTKKMSEVDATIWVSKNSLKPILVGNKGSMIREIGHTVRGRYKEITGEDIVLRMLVKVVDKWESRAQTLEELGYGNAL